MEMIAKRGEVFDKAVRKVRYFSADEQMRWQIESYEKARRDELMRINDAKEEGKAEGIAEGEAKGFVKGREEVAMNMLESGMSPDEVTKLSGLSSDRVAELDRARLG